MSDLANSATLFQRRARSIALLCALGVVAVAPVVLLPGEEAFAQQQQAQRVVQGKVVDKADAGLKGAVVYLKDGHTLAVKSYIAGDDGSYRFGQLAQNTDYSLWAESDGKKSAVKNISSFDTKVEFNITLKIDK
jgi:hypothetical protein